MIKKHLPKNYLNKNKTFAEIGIGAGITLRYAAKYFGKIYGLDISPMNIELTKKELKEEGYTNIWLYESNIMNKDERFINTFDVISFVHGLEHFSEDDYPVFFDNIKYYLKDGGFFTGALPNNLRFNFRMCPNCGHKFEIDGHLSRHTKESLRELFKRYNMEIIYISDFNYSYYLKSKGIIKTIYRFILHKVMRRSSSYQLEYIVRPQQCKK